MNRLMTWVKEKARGWCAPDYDTKENTIRRLHGDRASLLALTDQLSTQLRAPFEARETDSAPPWGNEDANNWRKFLASETGERVRRLVNYWAQMKAHEAALRLDRHEYACGLAAGWHNEGEFLLHRLSADLPPQTEGDTRFGTGAADLRERMAP